eukprot:TRINITY_DN2009_c0_g1_i9.p1 TRINITY_DN2009_c0_g1~~TRINITY_DN2009_c0_g1_i9.p1  ORF type:complete len:585 (-),score=121.04 TRINITY_DN2009_c0_g1_i9:149-1903(-)
MFPAPPPPAAAESAGASTPISRPNPNRQSPRNNQTTPTSRSTDRDTCYFCRQKGHWASNCPQNSNKRSSPSLPSASNIINGQDFPEMQCPCGAGICRVLTSKTPKNPGRKFYRCPDPGPSRCDFFEWCDTVTCNGVPNVVESSCPTCSCGAGKCILLTEKDGKDAGRKYFACNVKKGQGACNFKLWHDLLGKGSEGAVARELKFSDRVTLSHHGEQRASLSSASGEILDMVAYGGDVGEQPESVGQGARSYLQHLDGPGKDFQRDGVTRAIIFSDTGVQSQYGEQRKSFSPGPFEGEIIDGEASGDHIAVQSDSEVSDQTLYQFCEQIESRYSLLSGEPSEGEDLDTDASGGLISVQSGSEGGNSFAGPQGDEGYMSDILLSTARHFANEFLKHIQGLCIPFFLHQRNQLVEAICRATSFGVDCSFFVSQIDDLIQLIDDFQALSCLAKKGAVIQLFKNQLRSIDSEHACRRARLNTIEGELRIMAQAEGELVAERADVWQAFNSVNEELSRLASERQLLQVEAAVLKEAEAKYQQIKAELQEKIGHTGQEITEIKAALQTGNDNQEQLLERLGIYLRSLQMWD